MLHSPEGTECCLLLWNGNCSYSFQEESSVFSSLKIMTMFHKDRLKGEKKLQFLHRTTYELLTKGHLAFIYSGQSEGVLSMRLLDSGRKLKPRNLLGSLYQVNLIT